MDRFSLEFIDQDVGELAGCRFGEICIGVFRERFASDLTYWTAEKYERQWLDASSQIMITNKTAFITSITEPSASNFLRWWAMYREDDIIRLQEQLCFLDQLSGRFDPEHVARFVRDRSTFSAGQKISEWSTTISSVREFVERHR